MDQLTTVGIDLAKDVFAVCVLDVTGSVVERRVLRRDAFLRLPRAVRVRFVQEVRAHDVPALLHVLREGAARR